jgi:hypothetical protein
MKSQVSGREGKGMAGERERAQAVLVGIALASGPRCENRTNLYKAFYLSHLLQVRDHGCHLTTWPIVKMQNGPGVDKGPELIKDLVKLGFVKQCEVKRGAVRQFSLEIANHAEAQAFVDRHLDRDEIASVRTAAGMVKGHRARPLSDMVHAFSRSWQQAGSGQELDIYQDLLGVNKPLNDRVSAGLMRGRELGERIFGVQRTRKSKVAT